MSRTFVREAVSLCALAAALASQAPAGDLNPPGGPVVPTMKNLDIVEPRIPIGPTTTPGNAAALFIIPKSGSYYLTGNVEVNDEVIGIDISSSNVSLDLMGFSIIGKPGTQSGVIVSVPNADSITVHNGIVSGWGSDGIEALMARNIVIEHIQASGNIAAGIRTGEHATVSDSFAHGNAIGFVLGRYSRAERIYASENQQIGISTSLSCRLSQCASNDNIGGGITLGNDSTIDHCDVLENGGHGLVAQNATIEQCAARNNAGDGIQLVNDCSVRRCTVSGNLNDGIAGMSRCVIEDNSISDHFGGSGIRVSGVDGSIVRNRITQNDVGIEAPGGRYFIEDNVVEANSDNYQISNGHRTALLLSQVPEVIDFDCGIQLRSSLTISGSHPSALAVVNARVEIDMNGFALVGNATTDHGIQLEGMATECTIRNGELRSWTHPSGNAIHVVSCDQLTLESVRFTSCNRAILAIGTVSRVQVQDCDFRNNTGGVETKGLVSVHSCQFVGHGTALSIRALGATVRDCVFANNAIALNLDDDGAAHVENNSFFQNGLAIRFDSDDTVVSSVVRNSFRANTTLFMNDTGDMIGSLLTPATLNTGLHPHGNYLIP